MGSGREIEVRNALSDASYCFVSGQRIKAFLLIREARKLYEIERREGLKCRQTQKTH